MRCVPLMYFSDLAYRVFLDVLIAAYIYMTTCKHLLVHLVHRVQGQRARRESSRAPLPLDDNTFRLLLGCPLWVCHGENTID